MADYGFIKPARNTPRDPVMEALEETKALEALRAQRSDLDAQIANLEEKKASRPFLVADLVAELTAPTLNPGVQGFEVYAEGCDCTNQVKSIDIDMASQTITLEI